MVDLFLDEWMKGYMTAWNDESDIIADLEKIGFGSTIGYCFAGEDTSRGVIIVENGKATSLGAYSGEEMNRDLCAGQTKWGKWLAQPQSTMGLVMAHTSRTLQFLVGACGAMLKEPRIAGPFIKSFSAMGKVQ